MTLWEGSQLVSQTHSRWDSDGVRVVVDLGPIQRFCVQALDHGVIHDHGSSTYS